MSEAFFNHTLLLSSLPLLPPGSIMLLPLVLHDSAAISFKISGRPRKATESSSGDNELPVFGQHFAIHVSIYPVSRSMRAIGQNCIGFVLPLGDTVSSSSNYCSSLSLCPFFSPCTSTFVATDMIWLFSCRNQCETCAGYQYESTVKFFASHQFRLVTSHHNFPAQPRLNKSNTLLIV
jgi:hypothetical protein